MSLVPSVTVLLNIILMALLPMIPGTMSIVQVQATSSEHHNWKTYISIMARKPNSWWGCTCIHRSPCEHTNRTCLFQLKCVHEYVSNAIKGAKPQLGMQEPCPGAQPLANTVTKLWSITFRYGWLLFTMTPTRTKGKGGRKNIIKEEWREVIEALEGLNMYFACQYPRFNSQHCMVPWVPSGVILGEVPERSQV